MTDDERQIAAFAFCERNARAMNAIRTARAMLADALDALHIIAQDGGDVDTLMGVATDRLDAARKAVGKATVQLNP